MQEEKTVVIFRKWSSKPHDVLALFPEIPADNDGCLCQSYEHVGQHGGASYTHCIINSSPAEPDEYSDLYAELEGMGYMLDERKRATLEMHERRRASAKELFTDG